MDRNAVFARRNREKVVALRKESVDRNILMMILSVKMSLSLSARRAWIEIAVRPDYFAGRNVALRKESVDRNVFDADRPQLFSCRSPQGERG